MAIAKVNAYVAKLLKPLTYPCHIFGIIGRKLTTCPKFNEMQNMLKDQINENKNNKLIIDVKFTIAFEIMVDVHVATTRSITNLPPSYIYDVTTL